MKHAGHLRRIGSAGGAAVLALTLGAGAVAAHSHVVNLGTDQQTVIANGQNHPAFVFDAATGTYVSCDTNTLLPGCQSARRACTSAREFPLSSCW